MLGPARDGIPPSLLDHRLLRAAAGRYFALLHILPRPPAFRRVAGTVPCWFVLLTPNIVRLPS